MAPSYCVIVDAAMSTPFQHQLAQVLKAASFEEVVSLRNPTGLRVRQFRHGPSLLILSVSPEEGGRERINLSSETPSLESQISAVLTEAATKFLKECYG